ncbi:MAG: hypothetical protein OXI90_04155 [Gammaproteobacteria bacterium]|nr:hypothetical protein [Gammaproteobacteria bacterium]
MNSPSYDRAPSPKLRRLLAPGGFLTPLLVSRALCGIELEAHLRPKDEVHLYCGLTRLVSSGRGRGANVWIKSHKAYATQTCAHLLIRPGRAKEVDQGNYLRDEWTSDESGLDRALNVFLEGVKVEERQKKEGAIQAAWAQTREPWIAFDKEAAIAYPSAEDRKRQLSGAFAASVNKAREQLFALALWQRSLPNRRNHWAMPPKPKTRLELDQLAVDALGNLVLIEIKDATASQQTVYYAPFQLLQNVWEWHRALIAVRASVQELLDARIELGLSPSNVPPITGGLRAVIAFGEEECSKEVKRRYSEVLCIVNELLPADVRPIETWSLVHGRPVQAP